MVGADGANGISMKQLGIRSQWAQEDIALCIQAEVHLDESEVERIASLEGEPKSIALDFYYGLVEWGYGWCFPKRTGLNIGIGCRLDKARFLRDKWTDFRRLLAEQKGISLRDYQESAARVPLGGTRTRHIGRRSMLVGDAAGLVSPMTGEGISYAIESGILAAQTAVESVNTKSPTHVIEYERRLTKSLVKELNDLRFFAGILHKSDTNLELICKIVDDDPLMKEYLMDILIRTSKLSELRTTIVKRLLTHHPLKAIRLGL